MENQIEKIEDLTVPLCNSRCTICTHEKLYDITDNWHKKKPLVDIADQFNVSVSSLSRHFARYRRRFVADSGRDLTALYSEKVTELSDLRKKVMSCAMVAFDDISDDYAHGNLRFTVSDFVMLVALASKLVESPNAIDSASVDAQIKSLRDARIALPSRQQSLGFVRAVPVDPVSVS